MTVDLTVAASTATDRTNWLAGFLSFAAAAGRVLLTTAWIVVGLIVPPVRIEYGIQDVIGIGRYGPLLNAVFVVSGLLTIVGVLAALDTVRDGGGGG